jgi:hypothetical protein
MACTNSKHVDMILITQKGSQIFVFKDTMTIEIHGSPSILKPFLISPLDRVLIVRGDNLLIGSDVEDLLYMCNSGTEIDITLKGENAHITAFLRALSTLSIQVPTMTLQLPCEHYLPLALNANIRHLHLNNVQDNSYLIESTCKLHTLSGTKNAQRINNILQKRRLLLYMLVKFNKIPSSLIRFMHIYL